MLMLCTFVISLHQMERMIRGFLAISFSFLSGRCPKGSSVGWNNWRSPVVRIVPKRWSGDYGGKVYGVFLLEACPRSVLCLSWRLCFQVKPKFDNLAILNGHMVPKPNRCEP